MKKEIDILNFKILEFFNNKNITKEESVKITSGIDSTVTFIGAGISPLKKYFLEDKIPQNGIYIKQKCIRTHTLRDIYDINIDNKWASFFNSICFLVEYRELKKIIDITIELLKNIFNDSIEEKIKFKVFKDDIDIIRNLKEYNYEVMEDPTKYRHKYGLDEKGIYGRNTDIYILNDNNNYIELGNIIIIESKEKKYAVELALGIESLIMAKENKNNTLESSYVSEFFDLQTIQYRKYAECFCVIANLEYENVMKCRNRYPKYLYKKYLRALYYWGKELGISEKEQKDKIIKYLKYEYNN